MSLYSKFRNLLSEKNKGRLTRLIYNLKIKPTVNKKGKSFNKGVVVFSADFEMAWAFRFSKKNRKKAVELGLKEREQVPLLVDLFDQYDIPVTWATVGHLFLESCERDPDNYPHPDMIRPNFFENKNWIFNEGDWYQHDPCTSVENDPAWYAPDLIEKIIHSSAKHEIACHTFSHCDFSYANCTKQHAANEIRKCMDLAGKYNVELKSIVFPGGTAGNFEVLKQNGFIAYRKPMKYNIDMPKIDKSGLVAIPSSHILEKDVFGWRAEFHHKILKSFLQKTVKSKKVCHFWFHPSLSRWYLDNVLPDFLKMVHDMQKRGEIDVLTMRELSKRILKHD